MSLGRTGVLLLDLVDHTVSIWAEGHKHALLHIVCV